MKNERYKERYALSSISPPFGPKHSSFLDWKVRSESNPGLDSKVGPWVSLSFISFLICQKIGGYVRWADRLVGSVHPLAYHVVNKKYGQRRFLMHHFFFLLKKKNVRSFCIQFLVLNYIIIFILILRKRTRNSCLFSSFASIPSSFSHFYFQIKISTFKNKIYKFFF